MKKMLVALGLLAAVAGSAWAQVTDPVYVNGHWKNSTTQWWTDASGNPYVTDASRDRDAYLTPLSIYSGTIAAGACDSTSIVDLSGYRTVALLIQMNQNGINDWNRFAINARYNMAGLDDSLSLFTLPVAAYDDSVGAALALTRTTKPTAAICGSGEFAVTIPLDGGAATTRSLPQGKVVYLTLPYGMAWPARCSFRIANIGREGTAVTPTVRVWVMGTPL